MATRDTSEGIHVRGLATLRVSLVDPDDFTERVQYGTSVKMCARVNRHPINHMGILDNISRIDLLDKHIDLKKNWFNSEDFSEVLGTTLDSLKEKNKRLLVIHKGGPKGKWIRKIGALNRGTHQVWDLEDL